MYIKKDLQISVTNEQNLGLNWVLYSESDLNNYVAYATKRDGNKLLGNYNAKPEILLKCIYKYGGGTGNYTVQVK